MNIDTLRLFVEVARKLSFAAVAHDRDVNPSSVSRVIGQLEKHLALRLFHRTTRTMTLTEAGETYFRRISIIVDELEQAEEQARLANSGPMGTLKLTASVAFGERMIAPLVSTFRESYPHVKLELMFTDANVDLVSEAIDLAVRLGPSLTGDVVATKLFTTNYKVVASPSYLQSAPEIKHPNNLTQHPCTVFSLPAFRSEWKFRSLRHKSKSVDAVAITPSVLVSSALSLRSIVLQGSGPALLADWLIGDDISKGRLIDVFPNHQVTATDFDTAAWLVYPSRSYLPQKVRVMIDFLKEKLNIIG